MPSFLINWNDLTIAENGGAPRPMTAEDVQRHQPDYSIDSIAKFPSEYLDYLADELDKKAVKLEIPDDDEIWDEEDIADHKSWAANCRQAAQRLRARDFVGMSSDEFDEIDDILFCVN